MRICKTLLVVALGMLAAGCEPAATVGRSYSLRATTIRDHWPQGPGIRLTSDHYVVYTTSPTTAVRGETCRSKINFLATTYPAMPPCRSR